jgi:hypothetical protein
MLFLLGHSFYSVFWDWTPPEMSNFQQEETPAWKRPHEALKRHEGPHAAPQRAVAAVSDYRSLDISCEKKQTLTTDTKRVKISGTLCDMNSALPISQVSVSFVPLQEHKRVPSPPGVTLFSDVKSKNFTTDYFNLENGENKISLKFNDSKNSIKENEILLTIIKSKH